MNFFKTYNMLIKIIKYKINLSSSKLIEIINEFI